VSNPGEIIQDLAQDVQSLIGQKQRLQDVLSQLEDENKTLLEEVIGLREKLSSFQNKDKIVKIVNSVVEEGESEKTTELKRKINEYIREIDKCISHLSQ
jgi:hypothetical protein